MGKEKLGKTKKERGRGTCNVFDTPFALGRLNFWAMHVNQKYGVFPFYMPWWYQNVLLSFFTLNEAIYLKIWATVAVRPKYYARTSRSTFSLIYNWVRDGDRERDYLIGDFKHYLPLTGTIFGSKKKTTLDGQWKQNAIESVFDYKHKISFVSTY